MQTDNPLVNTIAPSDTPSYPPSNFEYIPSWNRLYIKDAYEIISRNELWRPFREALLSRGVNGATGFTYTNDPLYSQIKSAICSTYIGGGHSGSSLGALMREMEYIALNGEHQYRISNQGLAAE